MDDLIVTDDEYEGLGGALVAYGNALDEQVAEYLRVLDHICSNILDEGRAAENLQTFTSYAQVVSGAITRVSSSMQQKCTDFVQAIDDADEYIYD